MALAQAGFASPLQQSFSLDASTEYDSNPALTATNPQGVWVSTISPHYQVRWVEDKNEWMVEARVDVSRSSNQALRIDGEDPTLGAGWTHSYDRGSVGITAGYNEQSSSSTETDDPNSGSSNDTRTQQSVGAQWTHSVNELTEVSVQAAYETNRYQGSTGGTSTYTDYDNATAIVRIERLLSERNSVYTTVTRSRYIPKGGTGSTQDVALVGFKSELTPSVNLDANIGVAYVDTTKEKAINGSVVLTHEGERTNSSVSFTRSSSASGSAGFTESDQLAAAVTYEIDERTRAGVEANASKTYSTTTSSSSSIRVLLEREVYEDISIETAYQYNQQETTTSDADGSVWTMSVSYDIPEF